MKQIVNRTNLLVCLPISGIIILPVVILILSACRDKYGHARTDWQLWDEDTRCRRPHKFIICIRGIRSVYEVSPNLDIALLGFVAIVYTGGLTSAGRKVGLANLRSRIRSGVSKRVWGRPIFGCDRRRLSLTRDGEILFEYARAMLRLNDEAPNRFSARGRRVRDAGTPDLYAAYLLPEVLALEREELDIALMTNQPEFKRGDIIRHEPIVWVAGMRSAPELGDPLPLAMLPHGSVYRQIALEALGATGRRWSSRSMCDSIGGLQAAVFAGLAVSVFPRCAIVPGMRCLGRTILPPIELVLHRKDSVSEAAEQLARSLQKAAPDGDASVYGRAFLRAHVLAPDTGDLDRFLHRVAAEGLTKFLVQHDFDESPDALLLILT
jgi:DNA-binding transcriptional LysR family regulator